MLGKKLQHKVSCSGSTFCSATTFSNWFTSLSNSLCHEGLTLSAGSHAGGGAKTSSLFEAKMKAEKEKQEAEEQERLRKVQGSWFPLNVPAKRSDGSKNC